MLNKEVKHMNHYRSEFDMDAEVRDYVEREVPKSRAHIRVLPVADSIVDDVNRFYSTQIDNAKPDTSRSQRRNQ
jgi:hypothetical protein